MKRVLKQITLAMLFFLAISPNALWAGNKRLMSIMGAERDAQRKIVEAVYGLKIRASDHVQDLAAVASSGVTESKTTAMIDGIQVEEVIYDPELDIARVTAVARLDGITNIDGERLDLANRDFRCTGFGTATPANAGPLQALRAAEVDAYKKMAEQVVGLTLESHTRVENFRLASDTVKTRLLATIYLARITDFGWNEDGDAFVILTLDVAEAADILGDPAPDQGDLIEVEGWGAQEDDLNAS